MIEEELNDKDDSDQLGIICSRSDDLGVVETDISLFSQGDHDTDPCPLRRPSPELQGNMTMREHDSPYFISIEGLLQISSSS
jgi:hypothetical protein